MTALVLSACGGHATTPGPTTSTAPPTSSAPVAAPSTPSGPRTVKWVDLAVGECLTAIPQVDIGEVTADLVDCAIPHAAEVYLRAPMWVDTTIPDVANRQCRAGLSGYTGQTVDGGRYTVSYLVDAGQDRTGDVPNAPGTVICLLADANGRPLTGSAHR